jgi:hypothetical protein
MGRFDPLYNKEQRQAIVRAIVDEGCSAAEGVRRAAEGSLGTAPFDMPLSTARGLATRERTRQTKQQLRALEREEPGIAARIRDQALYILKQELTEIEERQHEGEEIDLVRVRRIARSAREIQRLSAAVEATASLRAPLAHAEPDPPSPEAQRLFAAFRARRDSGAVRADLSNDGAR